MNVLIATTIPAWAARDEDQLVAESWMTTLQAVVWNAHEAGHSVFVFAALEIDQGDDPFASLERRLRDAEPNAATWRFMIDDGAKNIGTSNRLGRICTGRNLAIEFAYDVEFNNGPRFDAILWVDADVTLPPRAVPSLLWMQHNHGLQEFPGTPWPVVAGHIPTYGLGAGERSVGPDDTDWRLHWTSAGFIMFNRGVWTSGVRWAHWADSTDDPFTQAMIWQVFGTETLVDHQLVATHHPERIGPLEGRPHDLRYRRIAR